MQTHPFVESSKELRQRFVTLLESLSGLRALTKVGDSPHDEHQILVDALDILIKNQDVERCSVFIVNDKSLVCAAGRDWADHAKGKTHGTRSPTHTFAMGEGIIGQAATERQLIHCKNTAHDPRFIHINREQDLQSYGSIIATPILVGDQLLGVLNVSHPHPAYFHPWHDNLLLIYSNVLGQMISHHRLLQAMEQQVLQRTRQLEMALHEAEELKKRYEQLAIIDDLTKLYNRRFFFPETNTQLARSLRNKEPFSILLMDLDYFKRINDTYGHDVGDRVLRDVAAALSTQTREGDILARFGGEEFVLALPSTDEQGATLFAERIRCAISELRWSSGTTPIDMTLSIGISVLDQSRIETPSDTKSAMKPETLLDELLKQSDMALYHCKQYGRNQVKVFTKQG